MSSSFLSLYSWFHERPLRFWIALIVVGAAVAFGAMRMRVSENLADFFPQSDRQALATLSRLKTMDRLTFILETEEHKATDPTPPMGDDERLIDAAELLSEHLRDALGSDANISLYYGEELTDSMAAFVYRHLPILLTDDDYAAIDSAFTPAAIPARLATVKEILLSPAGTSLAPYLATDPMLLALPVLNRLQSLRVGVSLQMDDGYLFSADGRRLVMFADLSSDFMLQGDAESLTRAVYNAIDLLHREDGVQGVTVYVYGAPLVTEANSSCVRSDEVLTLSISLTVLTVVLLLVFRSLRSVVLLIVPVAFGAAFAMAIVAVLGIELSQMALGAGATIMGLALSYSIHIVTHALHVTSVSQLIAEMVRPMTIGSLTTIGAFLALLFTSSTVLRHLGLFASLTLVGTLLFCLVFMPHLLIIRQSVSSRALRLIERVAAYDYSRNKWLIGVLCVTFVVSLFFFTEVRFNSDMSSLNYQGDARLQRSLEVMEETLGVNGHQSAMLVTAPDADSLAIYAQDLAQSTDSLTSRGLLSATSIATHFLPTPEQAAHRATLWNNLFTPSHVDSVAQALCDNARSMGFSANAFDAFIALVSHSASPKCISVAEMASSPIYSEWLTTADSSNLMLYFKLETTLDDRDAIFSHLATLPHCIVADMGYYSRQATSLMIEDFNWLLLLSSVIVAVALIMSYGRVELFLLTFMPMAVGWVIILGLTAIFGVEFNVVNIILSTFIFGVGDDYSIFIMDGLQSAYSRGKKLMSGHKTAIMLSAFAAMAGLGAQVFGRHPAVHSLGLLSIFGLVAVIVTSFVVQPVLFRLLITGPVARGGLPYTIPALSRGVVAFTLFGVTCLVCQLVSLVLWFTLRNASCRKSAIRHVAYVLMRAYLFACRPVLRVPVPDITSGGQAVVACNHQSFLDILSLMASSPKFVFIVKGWVMRSAIIGPVAEAMGFICVGESNELFTMDKVSQAVADGCSIAIFPEGSRSADCRVRRFHKGAAHIASELGLPLRPVAFYGNGLAVSKTQPLNLMRCDLAVDVLPDIIITPHADDATLKSITRHLQYLFTRHLGEMRAKRDTHNIYYRDALLRAYLYRGISEYTAARKFVSTAPLPAVTSSADGNIDAGYSPLGISAFWYAMTTDTHNVTATVDSYDIDHCRHSPLVSHLAAQGKTLTFITK